MFVYAWSTFSWLLLLLALALTLEPFLFLTLFVLVEELFARSEGDALLGGLFGGDLRRPPGLEPQRHRVVALVARVLHHRLGVALGQRYREGPLPRPGLRVVHGGLPLDHVRRDPGEALDQLHVGAGAAIRVAEVGG